MKRWSYANRNPGKHRQAEPMQPSERAGHYATARNGELTPAQVRRFRKKLNRLVGGDLGAAMKAVGVEEVPSDESKEDEEEAA